MKSTEVWHSERLGRPVKLARWGDVGRPVLLFPTAGGDAEEVERFQAIESLSGLLAQGRIKVYSCDSVAGRQMLDHGGDGSPGWIQDRFQEYIFHEVVPAIRADCQTDTIDIIGAGASIGAFYALAMLCRYPMAFSHALCMSGTYDLTPFLDGREPDEEFYRSSPIHFLPALSSEHMDVLRRRYVLFASGEGRWENIGETWHAAHVLGSAGVPNRVDSWGPDWDHDWPTWREMLPRYLGEWT